MRRLGAAIAVAVSALGVESRALAEPESERSVVVHIDSPEPVELQRRSSDRRNPFYAVCSSPCDEVMPADGEYRISGDAVRSSRRFVLPAGAPRDVIAVRPASSGAFAVGIVLISVGGLSMAIGSWVALASALADDLGGGNGDGRNVGLALAGGGLAAAIAGGVVAVLNGKTHVRQTGDATSQAAAPRALPAAAWRAGTRREGMESPMWGVPSVSASF